MFLRGRPWPERADLHHLRGSQKDFMHENIRLIFPLVGSVFAMFGVWLLPDDTVENRLSLCTSKHRKPTLGP